VIRSKQNAALAAFEPDNDAFVAANLEQLRAQRKAALELVQRIPHLSCVVPSGAFYLFPDVSGLLKKSFNGQRVENVDRLAEMLLEQSHIAVVPGSAFGSDRHVRISYAIPTEEIVVGLTRLQHFVQSLVSPRFRNSMSSTSQPGIVLFMGMVRPGEFELDPTGRQIHKQIQTT
jgi:aspartate aminotransferase